MVYQNLLGVDLDGEDVYHQLVAESFGRDALEHLFEGQDANREHNHVQIIREKLRRLELRVELSTCETFGRRVHLTTSSRTRNAAKTSSMTHSIYSARPP